MGINLFTSLCDKRLGYKKANATPHMHSMIDHSSKFFDTQKSVKLFTVQGVEKKQQHGQDHCPTQSNKWDAVTDVSQQESTEGSGSCEIRKGLKGHIPKKYHVLGARSGGDQEKQKAQTKLSNIIGAVGFHQMNRMANFYRQKSCNEVHFFFCSK